MMSRFSIQFACSEYEGNTAEIVDQEESYIMKLE